MKKLSWFSKSVVVLLVSCLMVSILAFPGLAAAPTYRIFIDGREIAFDVAPQNYNGRILVPLRAIFEEMGAIVNWNDEARTVTATKGDTVVVLTIGDVSPKVNGKVVPIDQPGVIVNGRTLAPLRFVGEAFGGTVVWDGDTSTVWIWMDEKAPEVVPSKQVINWPKFSGPNVWWAPEDLQNMVDHAESKGLLVKVVVSTGQVDIYVGWDYPIAVYDRYKFSETGATVTSIRWVQVEGKNCVFLDGSWMISRDDSLSVREQLMKSVNMTKAIMVMFSTFEQNDPRPLNFKFPWE